MSYISMEGLSVVKLAQEKNANNLANMGTIGYKREVSKTFSVPIDGDGMQTKVFSEVADAGYDFSSGPITKTQNPMDIAIVDKGFITVESKDGDIAYTRRGDLRLDVNSYLVNGVGNYILGENGRIQIPPGQISIEKNGTIRLIPDTAEAGTDIVLDKIKLVNPDVSMLEKRDDGLFEMKDESFLYTDNSIQIEAGALEQSNVKVFSELADFLELAKKYELNVKMMQKTNENDQASTKLASLR